MKLRSASVWIVPCLVIVIAAVGIIYSSMKGGPVLQISQTNVSLGSIKPQTPKAASILLSNTGESELQINSIQPSCSCMTVTSYDRTVPPGGSTQVKFQVTPPAFPPMQSLELAISTNDLHSAPVVVDVDYSVIYDAPTADSGFLEFGATVERMLPIHRTFQFVSPPALGGGQPKVAADDRNFVFKYQTLNNGVWLVTATRKSESPAGEFEGEFAIHLDPKTPPLLKIPYHGAVLGKAIAQPGNVTWSSNDQNATVKNVPVQIRRRISPPSGNPEGKITISSINVPSQLEDFIGAHMDGKEQNQLVVNLKRMPDRSGIRRGAIEVRCVDSDIPGEVYTVVVPIVFRSS